MDQHQLEIIQAHSLGIYLDAIRDSLHKVARTPTDLDLISTEVLQVITLDLLPTLQSHPLSRQLPSKTGRGTLRTDLLRLEVSFESGELGFRRLRPLFHAVFTNGPDVDIWQQVYNAVATAESTPPRKPAASFEQTPRVFKTSSVVNSSERRIDIDKPLRDELGVMYVDVPNFYEAFFGDITDLETRSTEIFQNCTEGEQPLFRDAWTWWPENANEADVLTWLAGLVEQLKHYAREYEEINRRIVTKPYTPVEGSVAQRKLDVGFADVPKSDQDQRYHWSQILVPGELKSNPKEDTPSQARLNVARYVKEVFIAQPTRRFVLAFTLCGTWMRLWEFDRLGGIASTNSSFGLDPTIITTTDQQYIEVKQHGKTERFIIDKCIRGAQGIIGRAITCWKAHFDSDKSLVFVIKDSWQYPERDEGDLLKEATEQGVINVARYYHHETVRIGDKDDNIQANVRKGLDITKASNYNQVYPAVSTQSRASSTGSKRSASQLGAPLPPSKRFYSGSESPTKPRSPVLPNRIHRRIILRDYGQPIYKASSRVALLRALEGCVGGHESLYNAGLLHRDISINNLMINEDEPDLSRSSFLIDLDLAIRFDRTQSSGAHGITGTRAFIAIGVLLGDEHSFMDDLESFFWVLFWICIHCDGYSRGRSIAMFDKWNWMDAEELASQKLGRVSDEDVFHRTVSQHFTRHYQVLIPWVDKLRRTVFPNGGRWREENETLYSQMREILRKAQADPLVAAIDESE
ncbi:hypothetical protein F5B22DRAFT_653373 [Xylaria bambusicola]|uniref:uncharacterized protein n=1 Tax=Xylaria bambusicola TaxID=326684 RepID=UPI00200825B4|nr:uncharacterized protein F5B22DRAFT_653373 [Xylaria bambusicola]KAI0520951.1 hypothetical protein F5B22DRAFT_653373 [Xylaria bambusicola]